MSLRDSLRDSLLRELEEDAPSSSPAEAEGQSAAAAAAAAAARHAAAARFAGASPLLSSSPFPFVLQRRSRRPSAELGGRSHHHSPGDRRTVHGFSAPTDGGLGGGGGGGGGGDSTPGGGSGVGGGRPSFRRTSSSLTAAVAAAARSPTGGADEAAAAAATAVPTAPFLPPPALTPPLPSPPSDLEAPPVPASPRHPGAAAAAAAGAGAGAAGPAAQAPPSTPRSHGRHHRFALALSLGAVNGLVGLPTMVAFAAIVYKDRAFAPDLGGLSRLAFLASGVQQAVFSARSRLPFAVGQVQDVGLIILSSMASSVAARCREAGVSREAAVAAAVWSAALATFAVGVCVSCLGHFRLASLSVGVPLSVVGGYLGFVGAFCGVAGLGLTLGGEAPSSVGGWVDALTAPGAPARVGAAFAIAGVLLTIMRRSRSPAALPAALAAIPVAFHVVRLAAGISLDEAAAAGWTLPPEPPGGGSPAAVYRLFTPVPSSGAPLAAVLAQALRALALAGVVMFGACLDVSAISSAATQGGGGGGGGGGGPDGGGAAPAPLDVNREVETVGLSNVLAGAVGAGFTGSWIFSQTLFSARAGVAHRWAHGAAIAALELAAFGSPLSILRFLPASFVAALLLVFAAGICEDYLLRTRARLSGGEYALLWATFVAIVALGLEVGIAAGVAVATADFAYRFARTRVAVTPVAPSRAAAARPPADRALLAAFLSRRAAAVSLGGYVFFGSALSISESVMTVARALAAEADAGVSGGGEEDGGGGGGGAPAAGPGRSPTPQPGGPALDVAWRASPLFLLLDFRAVRGLDATAAQAFVSLARSTAGVGVTLVLCHLRDPRAVRLLAAHGFEVESLDGGGGGGASDDGGKVGGAAGALLAASVMAGGGGGGGGGAATAAPTPAAPAFDSADDAVWACEEAFLAVARSAGALARAPDTALGVEAALAALCGGGSGGAAAAATTAAPYFETVALAAGGRLWSAGERADALALVLAGTLVSEAGGLSGGGSGAGATATATAASPLLARLPAALRPGTSVRRSHAGPGSTLGVGACFARAARAGHAVAVTPAVVALLTRPALARLQADAPAAAATLLAALLRVQALEAAHARTVLELSAAAVGGG